MLELAIVALWTAFVCGYLVWQQITGDLDERSAGSRQGAIRAAGPEPARTAPAGVSGWLLRADG